MKKLCKKTILVVCSFFYMLLHTFALGNEWSHTYDIQMKSDNTFQEIKVLFQKQQEVVFTLTSNFTYTSDTPFFILASQENYFFVTDTRENIIYTFNKNTSLLEKITSKNITLNIHYSSKGKVQYIEIPTTSQTLFFIYDSVGRLSYIKDTTGNISKLIDSGENQKTQNKYFTTFSTTNSTGTLAYLDEKETPLYNKKTTPLLYKKIDGKLYSIEDTKHIYSIDTKTGRRAKIFSGKNILDLQVGKNNDLYILCTEGIKKYSFLTKKEAHIFSEKNISSFGIDEKNGKIYYLKTIAPGYFVYHLKTKTITQNMNDELFESISFDRGKIHLHQVGQGKIIDSEIEFGKKYASILSKIQKSLKKKHFTNKQTQLLRDSIEGKLKQIEKNQGQTYKKEEQQYVLKKLLQLLETSSL